MLVTVVLMNFFISSYFLVNETSISGFINYNDQTVCTLGWQSSCLEEWRTFAFEDLTICNIHCYNHVHHNHNL